MSKEKRKLNKIFDTEKEQLEYEDTLDPVHWTIYKSAVDEEILDKPPLTSNRKEKPLREHPIASEDTSVCEHKSKPVLFEDLDHDSDESMEHWRCVDCGRIVNCPHLRTGEIMTALNNKQDDLVRSDFCLDCQTIIKTYET